MKTLMRLAERFASGVLIAAPLRALDRLRLAWLSHGPNRRRRLSRREMVEYFAMTAHELRTALHGITGNAELVRDETDTFDARESANDIIESGQRMLQLLDQLLLVSRAEFLEGADRDAPLIHAPLVPCATIVHGLLQSARGLALAKGLTLTGTSGQRAILVPDSPELEHALRNLLDNAIKFTDTGSIRITAGMSAVDRCRIAVIDNGPGLSTEQQRILFEPFSSRSTRSDSRLQGSGLGLYLAQKMIVAAGGNMGLVSAPGEGSTFWVEIPATQVCETAQPSRPSSDRAEASREAR